MASAAACWKFTAPVSGCGRRVWSHGYPAQLARIQPVQLAAFAAVDDDVPGPTVGVAGHRLSTTGAVEQPTARILPTGQCNSKRALFAGANGVDDRRESIHVDQHAVAARASEQWMAIQPTGRAGGGAGGGALQGFVTTFN